jgi:hypothetical protein
MASMPKACNPSEMLEKPPLSNNPELIETYMNDLL